jgi:hypothetical protein
VTPGGLRFFHFGVGYRLTGRRTDDVFVNPCTLMPVVAAHPRRLRTV